MSPGRKKRTSRVIDAAMGNWDLVQSRLSPIIGQDGFRVLFARSLHRARLEHAWLARDPAQIEAPFAALKRSLESQPAQSAADGSRVLVAHFNELLNVLIGKELATRLTGPVRRAAGGMNQEIDR